jgi:hypothetical protein
MDDLRKIVVTREEAKAENQRLMTLIEGLGTKIEALGKPPGQPGDTPPAGTPPEPTGLELQVKQIADAVKGIVDERGNAAKSATRKAITDAIVGQANEQSRELVRGAVAMMALDGKIDLHADDAGAQVEKAVAELRGSNPGYFAAAPSLIPVPGEKDFRLPAGIELHQLTEEQINRIPQEEFNKLLRAPRTSGLAF